MFGLVARFDLADAEAARRFDALTSATCEQIKSSEPGTLLYLVNTVSAEPLARIFYELYIDRDSFEAHESTAHVKHFLAEREQYITNLRVEFIASTNGKPTLR
ncbi:putative quinol monooxygenase [Pseudonocardia sp. ICBG1142]|uniref:putative quinol monooxygenase n=1 Tax=Pseudonocardia sp. ICBG1142 TaxID=2846760 RepID=UPI001CF6F548|nr:antibiotic biosynthesis monooxygenase [Pseudonocardia sp. ICBG1142]